MTEEEKKAIEYLKRHIIPYYENKGRIEFMLNDTLLNLIEKLQKENEELKEKVFKRDKEFIRLEEYANKNFERKDDVKARYIPKDKIRNFIEKHKDNFYDGTANGCDYIDYEVIKEFIEEE